MMKKKRVFTAMIMAGCLMLITACSGNDSGKTLNGEAGAASGKESEAVTAGSESTADLPAETEAQVSTQAQVEEEEKPAEKVHKPAEISLVFPSDYLFEYEGEQGKVEKITYTSHDHIGDGPDVDKLAYVYVPAGYDESKQYNIVYLMHGIGGSEEEWGLGTGVKSRVKKILDRLIGDGDIEPCIVVTPNGRALASASGNDAFYQFGSELRNDLMPYIESHYAVYKGAAEGDENAAAINSEARLHRAMAGLSMGGMQTINIGVCESLDIMAYFGAFSAAPTSYQATRVAQAIDESEYEVGFFYNICGTNDNVAYGSASAAAKNLPVFTDRIVDGENFMWQEKGGGHDFNIWYLGFYNFMLKAFK